MASRSIPAGHHKTCGPELERLNLVPRVLWLFGQRMGASRDSGIMEKDIFFLLVVWITMEVRQEVSTLTGNSATSFRVLEVDLKCQARVLSILCVFILFFPIAFKPELKQLHFKRRVLNYVQRFLSE